jgi:hypothetical protein
MREVRRQGVLLMLMWLASVCACSSIRGADDPPETVSPALAAKAISVLQTAMKDGKEFERVHAAESLIWTGHAEGVRQYFLDQDRTEGDTPKYRIGIWRVLYRTAADKPTVQEKYLQKLVGVLSDAKAEDRETVAETLGKIKYSGSDHVALVRDLAAHGKGGIAISARWILANSGKEDDEAYLAESLRSKDPKDRLFAAYALRFFPTVRPATLKILRKLAATEPADGEVRHYVLGALYTHLPAEERQLIKQELLRYAATGNTDQRYESCVALANWPTSDMAPVVEKLLKNKASDERVAAAYLLLRIGQPRNPTDPNH